MKHLVAYAIIVVPIVAVSVALLIHIIAGLTQ